MSKKKKEELKNEQDLASAEDIIIHGMLGLMLVFIVLVKGAWFLTPIGGILILDAIWNIIRHIRKNSTRVNPDIEIVEYIEVTDSLERKQVVERVKSTNKIADRSKGEAKNV